MDFFARFKATKRSPKKKKGQCDNPDHAMKPSVFYCSDCEQPLCSKCCIREHSDHRVLVCQDRETPISKLPHQVAELVKLKAEREKKKDDQEKAEVDKYEELEFSSTERIQELFNQIHDHDTEWGKLCVKVERHRIEMERHRNERERKAIERQQEKEKLEQISKEKKERIREIGELVKLKANQEKNKEDQEKVEVDKYEELEFNSTERIQELFNQIHDHDTEWDKLCVKVELYRIEMERHRSEKERKTIERQQEKEKLERNSKEKEERIREIGSNLEKHAKMIDEEIRKVTSLQKSIQENIERGEMLIAERHLRPFADIAKIEKMLRELAVDAEVDRATDMKAKMLVYSSAARVARCEIPDSKYIVYGVTFVTSDRIAICGGIDGRSPWTVRLWDVTSNVVEVIVEGSDTIMSLAYLGNNTIVGLSMESPVVRIIDLNTKNVRGIDVNLDDKAIDDVLDVAVDDRGYFLITYGEVGKSHLVLVDNVGEILDIETGYPYKPTFCRKRGIVVVCDATDDTITITDTITCYKLQDDSLTEVMSASHGVEGFDCYDICSGSMGEIFIVGTMEGDEPEEIRLYQLDIDEEKKQIKVRRIDMKDGDVRSNDTPLCSVLDDKLVIGYDNKLELFRLS